MSIFKDSLTVLLSDPENPREIEKWCVNSAGFVGIVITDVSDVSMTTDTIYAYTFENQEAVNWFKLRWL